MPNGPTPSEEQGAVEADERFPSGPWVGFWLQRPLSGRQWMRDVHLRFAGGKVTGFGQDSVGEFAMQGRYDLDTGTVVIHKHYVGSHTVTYEGRNENDGKWVWGVWTLREMSGTERGGFHLWPKGEEDPTVPKLEAEEDLPVEERVLVGVGEGE